MKPSRTGPTQGNVPESASSEPSGACVVQVDVETRILRLRISGALTMAQGLQYRRDMLAACARLSHKRPWGVLSDRRRASVQSDEVQAIMGDVFEQATLAGRTRAAVIATSAITQLQMRRLAFAANIVQKQFSEEPPALAWLLAELK